MTLMRTNVTNRGHSMTVGGGGFTEMFFDDSMKKGLFCQVKERDLNSDAKYFLNPTNNLSDLF